MSGDFISKKTFCEQYTILCTPNTHRLRPLNPGYFKRHRRCMKVREWEIPLQHRLSAQRLDDDINMWPNSVLTFNHSIHVKILCLGYLWILRNKNVFKSLKILKKSKSWSAEYTTSYTTKYPNWCHPTGSLSSDPVYLCPSLTVYLISRDIWYLLYVLVTSQINSCLAMILHRSCSILIPGAPRYFI